MQKIKLDNLELSTGIHTVSIVAKSVDFEQKLSLKSLNGVSYVRHNYDDNGELQATFRFNPEKYFGESITSPDLFKAVVQKAMYEVGITDYIITRADITFDSCNDNDFDLYSKLNRFVISLMSVSGGLNNRYESIDYITMESLSIKAKSKSGDREIETYNKRVETFRKGRSTDVTNRLEFRKSGLNLSSYGTDYKRLSDFWIAEMSRAIKKSNIVTLEAVINKQLAELYKNNFQKYSSKTARADSVHTINKFITAHQNFIYTKRQLVAFYKLIGVAEPTKRADDYKRNHYIEFFSQTDLHRYTAIISETAKNYISNNDNDVNVIMEII